MGGMVRVLIIIHEYMNMRLARESQGSEFSGYSGLHVACKGDNQRCSVFMEVG